MPLSLIPLSKSRARASPSSGVRDLAQFKETRNGCNGKVLEMIAAMAAATRWYGCRGPAAECDVAGKSQRNAPNTFATIALPAAAGFCLMVRSSSPIIRYRPSSALSVTYCSMFAASPLTRPSLTPCPAN
jgi:hypothetical protein